MVAVNGLFSELGWPKALSVLRMASRLQLKATVSGSEELSWIDLEMI